LSELKLYGLKSCDSCRNARKWLDLNGHDYTYHDVRSDGLDAEILARWSKKLDWQKLLNKKSLTWRKISEVDRAGMNEKRAMAAFLEQPTLIKRPLIECDEFIAVGFSPDNYAKLFAG
jgi:Spx/MgsR family transcriptional regulator